jgi:hypothetical protein
MKKASLDNELRSRIENFVTEIAAAVRASILSDLQTALGSTAAAPKRAGQLRAPAGRRAARAGGKRGKRTPEQVAELAQTLRAHIQSNPGQRLEEMSVALSMPTKEMKLPIAKLLAEKAIRTEGQKRGTRYFAGGGRRRARKA